MTHWADVEAANLRQARGDGPHLFATAITPSGPIHVGNMREVLTSEAIFRATREAEWSTGTRFIYIADDYDPLRKVYPFLHPTYQEHVGKPLREIPCPDADGRPNGCGQHDSYAAHFLAPFLDNLDELGIEPEVMSAYQMYHVGDYSEVIRSAMENADAIRGIIERLSKRQLPQRWAPFNPQCPTCRRISGVDVHSFEGTAIQARCNACEADFEVDATEPGAGKLPWRIDWPARWVFLGVTFEASGKDHHAAGGSWATGQAICEQVFDHVPPHGIMYEFLNLKGKGAMHSSSGLAVSAADVLQMTPPEVLRYLLMRQSPRKHIDFDPGLGVLNLVEEFDRMERIRFGLEENPGTFTEVERTYQLSCPRRPPEALPHKAPYKHLVTVAQMADDVAGVEAILRRSGELDAPLTEEERAGLAERVAHVRYWIDSFAPAQVRFQVQAELPDFAFTADQASMLGDLAAALAQTPWDGKSIHDAVYEAKGDRKPGEAFLPLYQAILGQDRGPRAGAFLASLEKDWVLDRLRAAAAGTADV